MRPLSGYGASRKQLASAIEAHLPVCGGIPIEGHALKMGPVKLYGMASRGNHHANAPGTQRGNGLARVFGHPVCAGREEGPVYVKEDDLHHELSPGTKLCPSDRQSWARKGVSPSCPKAFPSLRQTHAQASR